MEKKIKKNMRKKLHLSLSSASPTTHLPQQLPCHLVSAKPTSEKLLTSAHFEKKERANYHTFLMKTYYPTRF